MPEYRCTKRCYQGRRLWKPGEIYIGDQPLSHHFKPVEPAPQEDEEKEALVDRKALMAELEKRDIPYSKFVSTEYLQGLLDGTKEPNEEAKTLSQAGDDFLS